MRSAASGDGTTHAKISTWSAGSSSPLRRDSQHQRRTRGSGEGTSDRGERPFRGGLALKMAMSTPYAPLYGTRRCDHRGEKPARGA